MISSSAVTIAINESRPWQLNFKVLHPTGILVIGTLSGIGHVGVRVGGWRIARPACVSVQGEELLRGPDRTKWTVVS